MTWNTGTYISGIGHGALIVWVLVGGVFLRADDPLPLEATVVSLLSGDEFAALIQPDESPSVASQDPAPQPPEIEDDAPNLRPSADVSPQMPDPVEVVQPETETLPEQPQPDFSPQSDLADDAPDLPTPPDQDSAALVVPDTEAKPVPAPAPRIAPRPAAEPEPDTEIADTVAPEVIADEASENSAEETPATAPEEAATEIVTEAETPTAAPKVSRRPKNRPKPPPRVAQEPKPEPPKPDAIANAVAAAVADSSSDTPVSASGPPLTRGEKDALRIAVQDCWNVGSLSSEALQTTVVVSVSMSREAKPDVASIRMLSFEGGSAAAAAQAFEAARRAVIRCGARGYNLPSDKYSQWQNIEMTFNPEKMRIK